MRYYNDSGLTFNQIAAAATIGGAQYGLAIARHNNYADANSQAPATVEIPDDWIGNQQAVLVGRPPPTPTTPELMPGVPNQTMYVAIGIGVLALLLALSR